MPKLIFLRGISGSGKSSWARNYQKTKDSSAIIVTKDDIRDSFFSGLWSRENEKEVLQIRDFIIERALKLGRTVISADTNLAPKHEVNLRKLAVSLGTDFEVVSFTHIPLEECIKRDLQRPNSVGERVIRKQYYDFVSPVGKEGYRFNDRGKLRALIVDVDGTLAFATNRSYYGGGEKILDDELNVALQILLRAGAVAGLNIIIVSGREDKEREWTIKWLQQYNVPFDQLLMRETGDSRPDEIIKSEIYDKYIEPEYDVLAVFDDRKRVKNMWVEKGLYVFDCNQFDIFF